MSLSIVPDKPKPKNTDRVQCPIHGVITYAMEAVACPEVSTKGRWIKKSGIRVLICAECHANGKITEVAR